MWSRSIRACTAMTHLPRSSMPTRSRSGAWRARSSRKWPRPKPTSTSSGASRPNTSRHGRGSGGGVRCLPRGFISGGSRSRHGGVGVERDAAVEGGPAPARRFEADLAAVLVDDLLDDGEPEAGAVALAGGHERLEELVLVLLGDAGARVGEREQQGLA